MEKNDERHVIQLIYQPDQFAELIESEKPDFLLKRHSHSMPFGVEITQHYFCESQARLKNIGGYFDDIISGNRYRHKKDIKQLAISTFALFSPDGVSKGIVNAIHTLAPAPEEYVERVLNVIRKKGKRCSHYSTDVTHVNLIIFDTVGMDRVESKDFYDVFYEPDLVEEPFLTPFREIFFITRLVNDRWVYVPMRQLLLVSKFWQFQEIMLKYFPEFAPTDDSDYLLLFGEFMSRHTLCYHRQLDGELPEIVVGNCGLTFTEGNVAVREHADRPYFEETNLPFGECHNELFASERFSKLERDMTERASFEAEMAFDVLYPEVANELTRHTGSKYFQITPVDREELPASVLVLMDKHK